MLRMQRYPLGLLDFAVCAVWRSRKSSVLRTLIAVHSLHRHATDPEA